MGTIIINPFILHGGYQLLTEYDFYTSQPWTDSDHPDDWAVLDNQHNGTTIISEENANGWSIYSASLNTGMIHNTILPTSTEVKVVVDCYSITASDWVIPRHNSSSVGPTIQAAGIHEWEFTTDSVATDFELKRGASPITFIIRSVKVYEKI